MNFDLFFIPFNQLERAAGVRGAVVLIQDMVNVQNYYRDYGYQLIIVLTQNNDTELPTTNDIQAIGSMLFGKDANKVPILASNDETIGGLHAWFEKDFHEPTLVHIGPELNVLSVDNDDCSGVDRDPCPYMGTAVPDGMCWANPDPDCEPLDYFPKLFCACPAPACEAYCGEGNCPVTY